MPGFGFNFKGINDREPPAVEKEDDGCGGGGAGCDCVDREAWAAMNLATGDSLTIGGAENDRNGAL